MPGTEVASKKEQPWEMETVGLDGEFNLQPKSAQADIKAAKSQIRISSQ